ncbi:MAG: TlpA family protein disulfide reductase [Acidobacteria bacterium]|nr:TlpA family protein disulfide reductase [Acidobacteriota bacterium]
MKIAWFVLAAAALPAQPIVTEVRKFTSAGDLAGARKHLDAARGNGAWTPDLLLAHSWIGRGAHATKQWAQAERSANETRVLCLDMLKSRKIDDEKSLPLALGASIEVTGHAMANTGRLAEGVDFLKTELKRWRDTSMRARIQKNLHLLSLEGKKAPKLETNLFLGDVRMKSLADFKGKPALLFLWAHWCSDCKEQGPVLEALRKDYPGLAMIAPTQRYGYAANGDDATPEKETPYIATVQKDRYAWMSDLPMPVSEENFRAYGVSSTPTLVLLDAKGIVRMYHPGKMTAAELRPVLDKYAR